MEKRCVLLLSLAVLFSLFSPQQAFGKAKTGTINYYLWRTEETNPWVDANFLYSVGGGPFVNARRLAYVQYFGPGTLNEYLAMKDWAKVNGFNHEDMLLHANKNYTSVLNSSEAWTALDKFDAFEGKNGILKCTSGSCQDLTDQAYNGEGAFPGVTLSDTLYVGYEEPFADINMIFSTVGNQVNRTFEYWDGSGWAPLAVTDGTAGFTKDGLLTFVPPAGWQPTSINGSRNKYFIRFAVSSAAVYPVTRRIYGDNWGAGLAIRGWDPSSSTMVNRGTLLEYNPTPPAGASAKFRYQARTPYWSSNHFAANPGDRQSVSGKIHSSWAKYVASQIVDKVGEDYGIMGDDGARDIDSLDSDNTLSAYSDFFTSTDPDDFKSTWWEAVRARYNDIIRYVRDETSAIKVGINAASAELVKNTYDSTGTNKPGLNLAEYFNAAWNSNQGQYLPSRPGYGDMGMDDYLPANNAAGLFGILMYQDNVYGINVGRNNDMVEWDRKNRGPMSCLSHYYMGENENTVFLYYAGSLWGTGGQGNLVFEDSGNPFRYDAGDEVVLLDGAVLHQSDPAAVLPPLGQIKRWAQYFPAMAVDIGIPDVDGFNRGLRGVWKTGSEIDKLALGGLLPYSPDIWRRDFTNALVLHRPAERWLHLKSQYDVYSKEIDLGGTYYPLQADGKTAPATSSIALRVGEGAILMKYPVGESPDITPPETTASSVAGATPGTVTVTLSCNDWGRSGCGKIYYTTDGSAPTTASTVYAALFSLSAAGVVKFFAVDLAGNKETVKMYDKVPATTTATPAGGQFTAAQSVTLSCSDGSGAGCYAIYYTTDGSDPNVSGIAYRAPLLVSSNTTLKFFALDAAGNKEGVRTESYLFNADFVDLSVTAASSGYTVYNITDALEVSATVKNSGTKASGSFSAGLYISADATVTTSDRRVAAASVSGLAAGATANVWLANRVPADLAAGIYYLGVIADYGNVIAESNETNNAYLIKQIAITANPPDLVVSAASGAASGTAGKTAPFSLTLKNQGTGPTSWIHNGIYLSTDTVITTGDRRVANYYFKSLAAGAESGFTAQITLPADLAAGTYYWGVVADYPNAIAESNEANNPYPAGKIVISAQ